MRRGALNWVRKPSQFAPLGCGRSVLRLTDIAIGARIRNSRRVCIVSTDSARASAHLKITLRKEWGFESLHGTTIAFHSCSPFRILT
jgi:hypothetical protein